MQWGKCLPIPGLQQTSKISSFLASSSQAVLKRKSSCELAYLLIHIWKILYEWSRVEGQCLCLDKAWVPCLCRYNTDGRGCPAAGAVVPNTSANEGFWTSRLHALPKCGCKPAHVLEKIPRRPWSLWPGMLIGDLNGHLLLGMGVYLVTGCESGFWRWLQIGKFCKNVRGIETRYQTSPWTFRKYKRLASNEWKTKVSANLLNWKITLMNV